MSEQLNIAELRRLASVIREPRHGIGCIASDCALASEARNALPALLDAADERDALRTEIEAAKLILPVCCGSLADAADTLRQERDALKAKLYPKPCGGCPGCGTGDCVTALPARPDRRAGFSIPDV